MTDDTLAVDVPLTKLLRAWWQELQNDTGARAELRRCDRPETVMLHPAYARLHARFSARLRDKWHWEYRLACVVGLLSHVREHRDGRLAKQMGGNPPLVSELRFRRLLQCDPDELYIRMIRVLRMLENKAALEDLIDSVFYWNDRTRKRWALDYFSVTPEQQTA